MMITKNYYLFSFIQFKLISVLALLPLLLENNLAQGSIPTFSTPEPEEFVNPEMEVNPTPVEINPNPIRLDLDTPESINIPLQGTLPIRGMPSSLPLSPGDTVRILIPGVGGEEFSDDYQVNLYGYLEIPFLEPVFVQGLDAQQVRANLREILIEKQFFKPELLKVSVQVIQFSPIQITVAGEVFSPGRILINTDVDRISEINTFAGDNPLNRYLTTALKTVEGVKPTADVKNIQIIRNGQPFLTIDLSGLFTGEPIEDVPLIAGDYIMVPPSATFQKELVRPTPITPDEVSLYISNLTDPGSGNAVQISPETSTTSFRYGTRFSQALISAQCVGGNFRNENRRALLVRTNEQTGESIAKQYAISDVIGQKHETEEGNPYIMPNDSIACFDSKLVNSANFFDLISTFLNPLSIINNIFQIFGDDDNNSN